MDRCTCVPPPHTHPGPLSRLATRVRSAYRRGVERHGLPYAHLVSVDTGRPGWQGRDPRSEYRGFTVYARGLGLNVTWGK